MRKFSKIFENKGTSGNKLSLDIHGVIDSMPEFFAFLSSSVVNSGGELHIVTGGSWTDELEAQLTNYGVKWTHVFSVYDHLIESGAPSYGEVQFPDGTIQKKFDNKTWDDVKGDYCRDNGISLHIDDTLIYNDTFTTPFARLWTHNNNPKAPNKDVRHLD